MRKKIFLFNQNRQNYAFGFKLIFEKISPVKYNSTSGDVL